MMSHWEKLRGLMRPAQEIVDTLGLNRPFKLGFDNGDQNQNLEQNQNMAFKRSGEFYQLGSSLIFTLH